MDLGFRTAQRSSAMVVAVDGEIDLHTAPQLSEQLAALEESRTGELVLDLTGVTFLDSSGLGVIVAAHRTVTAAGHQLKLVCVQPHIVRILKLTRLSDVVPVFDSLDAASA